ncbi:PAS domain-containing protein [Paracoccus binzhouensis]|uniref:PAS domain-containing protein n=1 Tax=Paracoccus binzhouensis TaxID=2796149 RepID=UPI0018EEE699|nr:PAS domain-containing protein [Paracoccus binzhouensis]
MTEIRRLDHDLEWALRAMGTHRAVLVLDLAGRIVAVNQTCLGMCGYRREELIGRPVVMLLDPSEKAPTRLQQVLETAGGRESRIHGLAQLAKSGRRFRVDARICPIRDDQGRVCLNVLFLREPAEEAGPLRLVLPEAMGMGQVIRLPRPVPGLPTSGPAISGRPISGPCRRWPAEAAEAEAGARLATRCEP